MGRATGTEPGLGGDEGERTVASLLREFLVVSAARGRSPTTLHSYRTVIEGFWIPELGEVGLEELTTHRLDVLYARLRTRARPAAVSTVRKYHAVLSAALGQAVRWGWLASNPARAVTLPSREHLHLEVPTPEQVRGLIGAAALESAQLAVLVLTASVTGCRRGELAALRWGDLEGGVLHVRGSAYALGRVRGVKDTKTGRARRVVVHERLARELEAWRARCEADASAAGATLGPASFIFSSQPDGLTPVNVNTVTSRFRRVASRSGLPSVHFHSLRHFAATQLISGGVDVRTAASRLGHANPTMTLSVYAHATTEGDERAAEVGARVLDGLSGRD